MGRRISYADSEGQYVGHFDPEKAVSVGEERVWDGSNHISRATGSRTEHEILYRTAGGRYVLNWWSQWQGTIERYTDTDATAAEQWLRKQDLHDVADAWFEAVEERSPGRPEIGGRATVSLGEDLLPRIDLAAADSGITRAEWLRRTAEAALVGRRDLCSDG